MNHKTIAIIPARGGSKRIPKKNIKDFLGKPLIAYSIETAIESGLFDRIIVSTDDKAIVEIATEYGAEVPCLRPKDISGDFVGTDMVIEYVLDALKQKGDTFDFVCTIYATAPLLQQKYLLLGYEELKNSDAVYSFSATTMPFPIQRTFKIVGGRCEMFFPEHYNSRSQDLEGAYQDAGQFYWQNMNLKSSELIFGRDSIPIILPRYLVQDIDTIEDWIYAEFMYQALQKIH